MSEVKPISAAGGVLFKKDHQSDVIKVALIFRREVWDLPKGKREEGESIQESAVREVAEEVGLDHPPQIMASLEDTYHEYVRDRTHYGKTTYWFAMQLPEGYSQELAPQAEEGIEKVKWTPLEKAMEMVGYDNLVKVLASFKSWYKKN